MIFGNYGLGFFGNGVWLLRAAVQFLVVWDFADRDMDWIWTDGIDFLPK